MHIYLWLWSIEIFRVIRISWTRCRSVAWLILKKCFIVLLARVVIWKSIIIEISSLLLIVGIRMTDSRVILSEIVIEISIVGAVVGWSASRLWIALI